jgi:hypothetical protein|tara:strand:+ start:34 stop:588 length:555 start_codon:yes stop_codon:yes gene_type:complete
MTKLCARGKSAAKRKFRVYPSAYANAYASKICAGKIKDPSGVKRKDFKGPKPTRARYGKMIQLKKGGDPSNPTFLEMLKNLPKNIKSGFSQIIGGEKKRKKYLDQFGKVTGGEAKVRKVIGGLKKASKTHAAQAKTLQSVVKASDGQFAQTLQTYDGSYMKGDLAGHQVSNKSLTNYYKGMIDD